MFEIDFHDLERGVLHDRGCARKVIRLIKYLRDRKGGTVAKLWSHLLKVEFMPLTKIRIQISDSSDAASANAGGKLLEQQEY